MALVFGFSPTEGMHTARFSSIPDLCYPYHPLYGTEFEMIGSIGGKRDQIFVRLPNNTTRGIPAWMFDPGRCAAMVFDHLPIIDPHALLELASLLDVIVAQDAHQVDEQPKPKST